MAPNISSGESGAMHETLKSGKGDRKEIYYNGYFYDVTDFVPRHPGGSVINFYTEKGEDASQAIQQFHYRSKDRVEAILKSFSKRPAEPHERGIGQKTLARHEALNEDFNKLFAELKEEGYFEPSIPHVIIRLLEPVALSVISLGIFFQCQTFLAKLLVTMACGFSMSRFAWLAHEAGHNSLTGKPKVDKALQAFASCFSLGGSAVWWNSQHNRHHAMPQRVGHDVDLATLPYVAFHTKTVKDPKEINSFFVRYQAIFYWTLDMLVIIIAWRYVLHPRYQIHTKAYYELVLAIPHIVYAYFVIGVFWYWIMLYWMVFFLGINFALSHSHLEVADEPTHWIEYSLTHTANIQPNMFVDYFMGYLNYQIEHHLFPTMPQFKQREICDRTRALAEKHGLQYRVFSYVEACVLAVKNLNDVGKELTSKQFAKEKTH